MTDQVQGNTLRDLFDKHIGQSECNTRINGKLGFLLCGC